MFGLRIHRDLAIGRPGCLEAPIYFMHRDGRAHMRWTKFGACAEHGVAGKERDKASIRVGEKPWQIPPPEEAEDA